MDEHEAEHPLDLHTRVALLEYKVKYFVTQDQFKPIRLFVYGFISMVMLTVLGYMLSRALGGK
jgi:hypothetical protein